MCCVAARRQLSFRWHHRTPPVPSLFEACGQAAGVVVALSFRRVSNVWRTNVFSLIFFLFFILQLPIIMLVAFSMCIVCLLMAGKCFTSRSPSSRHCCHFSYLKLQEIFCEFMIKMFQSVLVA